MKTENNEGIAKFVVISVPLDPTTYPDWNMLGYDLEDYLTAKLTEKGYKVTEHRKDDYGQEIRYNGVMEIKADGSVMDPKALAEDIVLATSDFRRDLASKHVKDVIGRAQRSSIEL